MENQGVPGNPYRGNVGDGAGLQPPILVGANNKAFIDNQLGDSLRVKPPAAPRPQDHYRDNVDIADSYRPLVLPLTSGNTFVMTSILI